MTCLALVRLAVFSVLAAFQTQAAFAKHPCNQNSSNIVERACGQPAAMGVVENRMPDGIGFVGWSKNGKIGFITIRNRRCVFLVQSLVSDKIVDRITARKGNACPDSDAVQDGASMNLMAHMFPFWAEYHDEIEGMAWRHRLKSDAKIEAFPYFDSQTGHTYRVKVTGDCCVLVLRSDGKQKQVASTKNDPTGMIREVCNSPSGEEHWGPRIVGLIRSPFEPRMGIVFHSGFVGAHLKVGFK